MSHTPSAPIFSVNECGKYKKSKGAQNKFFSILATFKFVTLRRGRFIYKGMVKTILVEDLKIMISINQYKPSVLCGTKAHSAVPD